MVVAVTIPVLTLSAESAEAQSPFSIVSSTVTSNFPDGIRFTAQVEGAEALESLAVRFRIGQAIVGSYEYLTAEREGADSFELYWRTNTSATYIPPGTIITYNFEMEGGGSRLDTEPEVFIYEDVRFEWTEVEDGPVAVAYHGPVGRRAEIVLEAIVDTLNYLGPILGVDISIPIRVTMYNNVKEMLEALPPGSATIRRELITEGQAFTDVGTLLVLGNGRLARGTASHEVTHILNHRAGDGPAGRVPAWLDEGLAEFGNVEPGYTYGIALEFAVATDRMLPITQMRVLPGDPEQAIIFYGQARSLIEYMIGRFGPDKMRDLLAIMKSGSSIDVAMDRVYGLDRLTLENQWRSFIGASPYLPPQRGEALPTPIPRPEIVPFSLTPSAILAEGITKSPTETPAEAPAVDPTPTAPPTPEPMAAQQPTPGPATGSQPSVGGAETPPDDSDEGGGVCTGSPGGGANTMDASLLLLTAGLTWLASRRLKLLKRGGDGWTKEGLRGLRAPSLSLTSLPEWPLSVVSGSRLWTADSPSEIDEP